MSIFYTLFVTLAGTRIGVSVQGAEHPEAQGFWAINYCQMSIFLYLICDTGRTRIGVMGTGGGAPGSSGVFIQ